MCLGLEFGLVHGREGTFQLYKIVRVRCMIHVTCFGCMRAIDSARCAFDGLSLKGLACGGRKEAVWR